MSWVVSNGIPRSLGNVAPGYETWNGPSVGLIPMLRGQSTLTYQQLFRSQPAIYAVVMKILKGIARLPLRSYELDPDGISRREIVNHALPRLIRRPWIRHSAWDLKASSIFDLAVHGKCACWKFRPGPGQPSKELWPVPWPQVQPISDQRGIIGFNLYLGTTVYSVSPDDIVYLEMPGGGVSPLEPLRRTLALEEGAIDWQNASLANGVTNRAVFTTKIQARDTTTMQAVRSELEKLYASPENAGRFAILGEGADVKPLTGVSAVDLELISQRKFSREEVCAVYDIQPSMLGFASTGTPTTYASAREFARAFYVDTLGPLITMIESGFNEQLVYGEPMWDGLFLAFDMSELLRPDPEAMARADLMDMQSGTTSTNQRLRARNLPPIGDVNDANNPANLPWVPANGSPLGQQPTVPDPANTEPAVAAAALLREAITGGKSGDAEKGL